PVVRFRSLTHFSFLLTRPPPTPPLFPYTTLFRSLELSCFGAWPREDSSCLPWRRSPRSATRAAGACSASATATDTSTAPRRGSTDRKSTRLNSSHRTISYAVFCLKKKKQCNVETA